MAHVEVDHAREQAEAQLSRIRDMLARLEHARDCKDDDDCDMLINTGEPDENGNSIYVWPVDMEWTRQEYHDVNAAEESISEDPLSVETRSGWHAPGEEAEDEEFCILLCTGGPAVRIVGDLGRYGEAHSARLEYQDWGTPWTEYIGDHHSSNVAILQEYANYFLGQ